MYAPSPSLIQSIHKHKIEAEPMGCQQIGGHSLWFTPSTKRASESSAPERQRNMKKTSTNKADQDIPVLKRKQLGKGVRGKYFQQYTQQSNVVVLKPGTMKAFPTSEAVNKALASMLAFNEETQSLFVVKGAKGARRKAA